MLETHERRVFDRRFAAVRRIEPESVVSSEDRFRYDLSAVGLDGVVVYSRKTYVVERLATYTEVNPDWKVKDNPRVVTELILFCLDDGTTAFMEWCRDDELEVDFTERKIPRREVGNQLTYDDGEVVDLADVDEICDDEEELSFNGEKFPYDDDFDMLFQSSDGRQSYVSLAEFGDEDEGRWLTIESWTDDPQKDDGWDYEVWLSRTVSPDAIDVVSIGKGKEV